MSRKARDMGHPVRDPSSLPGKTPLLENHEKWAPGRLRDFLSQNTWCGFLRYNRAFSIRETVWPITTYANGLRRWNALGS